MMAGISAAECGHRVALYEKNEKLGKKLYITGKGRCNLTNACDAQELFDHVVRNADFLYSAFYTCSNGDVQEKFSKWGCRLKVERGQRVFPASDKSSDVIKALANRMKALGVEVHLNTAVRGLLIEEVRDAVQPGDAVGQTTTGRREARETGPDVRQPGVIGGQTATGRRAARETGLGARQPGGVCRGVYLQGIATPVRADGVIVATGGLAYPATGSTGDGYGFARDAGHAVTETYPSLVPIDTVDEDIRACQGLALKNVGVSVWDVKKKLFGDFGELLFTHFGVSGPTVLTASAFAAGRLAAGSLRMEIDLKPALDESQVDARLLREFSMGVNKTLKNVLPRLFPVSLCPLVSSRAGVPLDKKIHDVTVGERRRLVDVTKHFRIQLSGARGFDEAVITRGGVAVREVNPSTCESKKVRGLYFAGEVLDVDALTGGFNLQIAWSTGWLAGMSAGGRE